MRKTKTMKKNNRRQSLINYLASKNIRGFQTPEGIVINRNNLDFYITSNYNLFYLDSTVIICVPEKNIELM